MQKLTRNSESKASGAIDSSPNATSGPISAPVVSSARCTPNDSASVSGRLLSEMSASRGAVRIPLPVRSSSVIAPTAPQALPTSTRPSLQSADRP